MVDFDPFGWCERFIAAPALHRLIRLGCFCAAAVFFSLRLTSYHRFTLKPLWLVETALFVVIGCAYAIRTDPVDRARGFSEVVLPFVGALLPFFLLLTPPHSRVVGEGPVLLGIFWWMTLSTALTVWGFWSLRRSFSVTVEARQLVSTGPYRLLRHPVYIGEVLTCAAVAAWRFSPVNLMLLLVFVGVQVCRAKLEEKKLERVFPDYRDKVGC